MIRSLFAVLILSVQAWSQVPMSPPPSPNPPLFRGEKKEEEDPNGRKVLGAVKDSNDRPVAGSVVKIKNMKTLSVRSFITKDDGKYTFGSLRMDAEYRLNAEYEGRESPTRTLSIFDERKTVPIDLRLEDKAKEKKK